MEIELTKDEHHLLDWLGKEDHSAYGECHGRAYDRLNDLGLTRVVHRDARDAMFNRVGLTDQGIELLAKLGPWQP